MTTTRDVDPRVAKIIAGALTAGPIMLWFVAWVMTNGGRQGIAPDSWLAPMALWFWAAVAVPGFAVALVLRGRAVAGAGIGAASAEAGGSERSSTSILTHLIIAWALLEGPALMGGALFLMTGRMPVLSASVALFIVGMAACFPRAEWFGADHADRWRA